MLLESIKDKISDAAKRQAKTWRLYSEAGRYQQLSIQDSTYLGHQKHFWSGLSLEEQKDGVSCQRLLTGLNDPVALETLGFSLKGAGRSHPESELPTLKIKEAARAFWRSGFNDPRAHHPCFLFEEERKQFETLEASGHYGKGTDSKYTLRLHWAVDHKGSPRVYSHQIVRQSLPPILQAIFSPEAILAKIRSSLERTSPWPAPKGDLPVLWSANTVSTFFHLFLRGFEAHRVLSNASFLNTLSVPTKLPVAIIERPQNLSDTDYEGTAKKEMRIFENGRPRALACTSSEAKTLEVQRTGHARRASLDSPARPGFWAPHIVPEHTQANLPNAMNKGIAVDGVEVESFDVASGRLRFQVSDARLIHHGTPGDSVEPFWVDTHVLKLIESFETFSDRTETHGVQSDPETPLVEITSPAAISPLWPIEGSVPLDHYW